MQGIVSSGGGCAVRRERPVSPPQKDGELLVEEARDDQIRGPVEVQIAHSDGGGTVTYVQPGDTLERAVAPAEKDHGLEEPLDNNEILMRVVVEFRNGHELWFAGPHEDRPGAEGSVASLR